MTLINGAFDALANSNTSATSTSQASLGDNFDTFLQLLTTQLENQNPLEPTDTDQFIEQLTQFSDVEQSLRTNENLENLIAVNASSIATSAVNYIGKSVNAAGQTTELSNGQASWNYDIQGDAASVNVSIRNEQGAVVFTDQATSLSGNGTYNWNGRTNGGGTAADGIYTISFDAQDSDGGSLTVDTEVSGRVASVDLSGNEPQLVVNGNKISIRDITFITE